MAKADTGPVTESGLSSAKPITTRVVHLERVENMPLWAQVICQRAWLRGGRLESSPNAGNRTCVVRRLGHCMWQPCLGGAVWSARQGRESFQPESEQGKWLTAGSPPPRDSPDSSGVYWASRCAEPCAGHCLKFSPVVSLVPGLPSLGGWEYRFREVRCLLKAAPLIRG